MQFSTMFVAAAAAFLPLATAHMRVTEPGCANGNNNAPLDPKGTDFPCMMAPGQTGVLQSSTTYKAGEMGKFVITGGATHGGGSCQVSITYDNPPTKNSVWKVLKSWHGGCPKFIDGNFNDDANGSHNPFFFEMPKEMKSGEAVFAWTWFNKVGNREMYMNCAAVEIKDGSDSDDFYNNLPDMFVANIDVPQSQCTTKEGLDILFPNPGQNLETSQGDGQKKCNFAPACGGAAPAPPAPPAQGDNMNGGNDGEYRDPTEKFPVLVGAPGDKKPTMPEGGDKMPEGGDNHVPINNGPEKAPTEEEGETEEGDDEEEQPAGEDNMGSGNDTEVDDNTGRKYGKLCGSGMKVVCDCGVKNSYVLCHDNSHGWLYPTGGADCNGIASVYNEKKANKFRRFAREHAKRHTRRF